MGPLGLSPTHVREALKMERRTKNTKHMEKSLGSQGTGVSLWIRNDTVNVWDRSGHQWVFPAISELATLFPWRAVKAKSEGRRVICKYPLHLCGLENQQIYPKDGQYEQGCRSSWLIGHSAQPTKHKDNEQTCHWLHRGKSHSKKQSCSHCVDWQPKETLDIFLRQQAPVIKNGVLFLPCRGPTGPLCLLWWRRERPEWAPGVLNYCSKLWPSGGSSTDGSERFVQIYLPKRRDGRFEIKRESTKELNERRRVQGKTRRLPKVNAFYPECLLNFS